MARIRHRFIGLVAAFLASAPVLFATDTNKVVQPPQTNQLAAGVYKAKPFSMLVVVPPAMDQKMVRVPGTNSIAKIPTVRPPLKLQKK